MRARTSSSPLWVLPPSRTRFPCHPRRSHQDETGVPLSISGRSATSYFRLPTGKTASGANPAATSFSMSDGCWAKTRSISRSTGRQNQRSFR